MNLDDILCGETDDSCAICGVKGPGILTIHHVDGDPSNNLYDNQIVLCRSCHSKHEQGLEPNTDQISTRKRHLIQKTLTTFGLNAMKIAARNNFGVVAMPFLLYHLLDLDYMIQLENQMGYGKQDDATARFAISDNGRRILHLLRADA